MLADVRRAREIAVSVALALASVACGSRSGLTLPSAGDGGGGSGATAGTSGSGGIAPDDDRCPSAIAGPSAMWGNCSTRDGRARVALPKQPHLTWTQQLPTDGGQLGLSAVVTGAENEAYVVTGKVSSVEGQFRRVRAGQGTSDWMFGISTDQSTVKPVVMSNGIVDLFARDDSYQTSMFQFDELGNYSTTTFGFDFYNVPPNPAVGIDGSLYLVHWEAVGTANAAAFVSRVRPDGFVAWTTPPLAKLVGASSDGGSVFPSMIALGDHDTPVTVVESVASSGIESAVLALDPSNGAVRWRTSFSGQRLGGPAVRPDGSIALLAGPLSEARLVLLEPQTGTPAIHSLSVRVFEIFAVTRSGVVIAGLDDGDGLSGVVALDGGGTPLWSQPVVPRSVALASDGTLVIFTAPSLVALDVANGATKWELPLPHPSSCLLDGAPTSSGGLVGIQCDGTLFGAGD